MAPPTEKERIKEGARREVLSENPGIGERLLRVPIQLRENKIIAEELECLVKDRGS
ncbi:MAG: hypothetical protein RDV48_29890 [Candidatus Eremiobacteraeota bacterium]|nr:hypothetical protein [Candidatus Eremiobacteraeota bacterium]